MSSSSEPLTVSSKAAKVAEQDTAEFALSAEDRAEIERLKKQLARDTALVTPNVPSEARQATQAEFTQAAAELAAEKLGVDVKTAATAMKVASESVERVARGSGTDASIFDQAAQQQRHVAQQAPRSPYTPAAARLADLWSAATLPFVEQIAFISANLNERFLCGTKVRPFPLSDELAKEVASQQDAAAARNQKPVYSDELLARVKQYQTDMRKAHYAKKGAESTLGDVATLRDLAAKQQLIYHVLLKMSMFEVLLLRWATGKEPSVQALTVVGKYATHTVLPALKYLKARLGSDWATPPTVDHVAFSDVAPWLSDYMSYDALISIIEDEFAPLASLCEDV